ncbi:hypothetical protein D3C84_977130 [compost metagenome]
MEEAVVVLSVEQRHAQDAGIARHQQPQAVEGKLGQQPRKQFEQGADQQHAQRQEHEQTQGRQVQRHQQPVEQRIAGHACDQHQAGRRDAQCVNLSAHAAHQRIDAQRPVQHEVVDQGSTDKRQKRFGHDRPYPMPDNPVGATPEG